MMPRESGSNLSQQVESDDASASGRASIRRSADDRERFAAEELLVAIVFDDEDEYVQFTDYVYDTFGGAGLEFPKVPILASARLTPWLYEQTKTSFSMRLVTESDLTKAWNRIGGRRPFDPETLEGRYVPGTPRHKSTKLA